MRELDLQISAWINLRDVIVSGKKKKKTGSKRVHAGRDLDLVFKGIRYEHMWIMGQDLPTDGGQPVSSIWKVVFPAATSEGP